MRSKQEDRQRHIAVWSESGLSRPAYCRESGLKYSTFMSWFKTESEAGVPIGQAAGRFVALAVGCEQLESLGEVVVRFPNGMSVQFQCIVDASLFKLLSDVGE